MRRKKYLVLSIGRDNRKGIGEQDLSHIAVPSGEWMIRIRQPYTLGTWTVKPGKEIAFIAEWQAFAKWTARNQPGAQTGILLQDPDHPHHFISFGPWDNADVIKAWRERPEFKTFVLKARELCDDFQPRTLLLAASSEDEKSAAP